MFFSSHPGKWLKPMGIMSSSIGNRPVVSLPLMQLHLADTYIQFCPLDRSFFSMIDKSWLTNSPSLPDRQKPYIQKILIHFSSCHSFQSEKGKNSFPNTTLVPKRRPCLLIKLYFILKEKAPLRSYLKDALAFTR